MAGEDVVGAGMTDEVSGLLTEGILSIEGQLSGASNATLLCWIDDPRNGERLRCVYKPRRGERPLWDFPTGSLGHREVATHVLDELLGWATTPVTVWRDEGPLGPGMCQVWVDDDSTHPAVDVVTPSDVPDGWKIVLEAQTYDGHDVLLIHEDNEQLKRIAVLDIITNNADRKGGHVLRTRAGEVRGIDHGLTFHPEPKLRTVLWGWAGLPLETSLLTGLCRLAESLRERSGRAADLVRLLSTVEYRALIDRTEQLIETGVFPEPDPGYPALPWPPM